MEDDLNPRLWIQHSPWIQPSLAQLILGLVHISPTLFYNPPSVHCIYVCIQWGWIRGYLSMFVQGREVGIITTEYRLHNINMYTCIKKIMKGLIHLDLSFLLNYFTDWFCRFCKILHTKFNLKYCRTIIVSGIKVFIW